MSNSTEPRDGSGVARGWSVQPGTGETSKPKATAVPEAPHPSAVPAVNVNEISNIQLVLFGVFGGVYLLYTVGWFLIAQYFAGANALATATSGSVGGVLQQVIFWAAAAAPLAWFIAVVTLSRGAKPWVLPVGLVVGLLVLLPLPLFTVGAG